MNTKLQELSEEMLNEIKNLKDLAKEELPLVVKEYIQYQKIMSIAGIVVGFLIIIALGTQFSKIAASDELSRSDKNGLPYAIYFTQGMCLLFMAPSFINLMKFKFMPRRSAIEAITSLFKTDA